MAVSLETLLLEQTKEEIYDTALAIATTVGLPVSSWQPGDPTRSLYHLEAEILSTLETIVAGYIASGFLDYAEGTWLAILADQQFGITATEATFATTDVVLTNGGGGYYPDIVAGDLTFKNSATGTTYKNTTGGTLESGPATTLTVTVVAEVAGSDGSASVGEIDTLVTTRLGVTCTNADAAVGVDAESDDALRARCRAKLGSLATTGAKGAYDKVALDSTLTGTTAITRVRSFGDSDTGDVTVYLAGASGAVAEVDRALVELAILEWATPLCVTPTVLSAATVTIPVTYTLWVYKSVGKTDTEVADEVETALEALFATRPIGGDIIPPATSGYMYRSLIESTIRSLYPQAFRVTVAAPASDTAIDNDEVAVLGTVTATINLVTGP